MKLFELLAAVSLSLIVYAANATEMESAENDYRAYCEEQANLSGIEDAAEKSAYIKECVESFEAPSTDAPQPDQ